MKEIYNVKNIFNDRWFNNEDRYDWYRFWSKVDIKDDIDKCWNWTKVYKLISRNLSFGVFDGNTRFIGIRTKCGRRFLDTEDHWDTGPPFVSI